MYITHTYMCMLCVYMYMCVHMCKMYTYSREREAPKSTQQKSKTKSSTHGPHDMCTSMMAHDVYIDGGAQNQADQQLMPATFDIFEAFGFLFQEAPGTSTTGNNKCKGLKVKLAKMERRRQWRENKLIYKNSTKFGSKGGCL